MKFPKLHIHGPTYYHDHSFIIGDRESLELLRDAIDSALAEGQGKATSFTADGEGFDLEVYREEDDSYWDKALLPYTDEAACVPYEKGVTVTHWDLFKKYRKKT